MNPPAKTGAGPVAGGLGELPGEPSDMVAALREEIGRLQRAIASHAVIDQAIGVVIALEGLRPEQGCAVLKEVSQRTDVRLRTIAEQIVAAVRGGQLPDETRQALGAVLSGTRPART